MDELEAGLKDTKIRRDTQVRGSLGVPPSGPDSESRPESERAGEGIPELERERTRGQMTEDDDRMSER